MIRQKRRPIIKITILTDNNTYIDRYFLAEPGLSIFIEDGESKILFDCGYSDVFIKNATKLKIDLTTIDTLVLSHNHLDHTWGLTDYIRLLTEERLEGRSPATPKLVSCPDTFRHTTYPMIGTIGSLIPLERISTYFSPIISKEPVVLSENCIFLGEIPRETSFEPTPAIGRKEGETSDDSIPEDSAIVYKSEKGLVIITGCSHAGICNIVNYAKKVCEDDRIIDIIGGLHLHDCDSTQLEGTVHFIGALGLSSLHACHCTGLQAQVALSKVAPVNEVGSGLVLEYS